jgi:hypothetical protein
MNRSDTAFGVKARFGRCFYRKRTDDEAPYHMSRARAVAAEFIASYGANRGFKESRLDPSDVEGLTSLETSLKL